MAKLISHQANKLRSNREVAVDDSKLILTMCNSAYEDPLYNDFIRSLHREGKYDGNVAILDYGLNNYFDQNNIKYIKVDVYPHFQTTVNLLRAKHLLSALEQYPKAKHIAYFDSGDLWFQDDIEPMFHIDGLGMAPEIELWGGWWWSQGVLAAISDEDMRTKMQSRLGNEIIRNAGVFAGDRESFIDLLQKQIEYTDKLVNTPFGIDQAIFNYLYYTGQIKGYDLGRKYNFVAQAHKFRIEGNKVFDDVTNEMPAVVHNAGNRPVPRLVQP